MKKERKDPKLHFCFLQSGTVVTDQPLKAQSDRVHLSSCKKNCLKSLHILYTLFWVDKANPAITIKKTKKKTSSFRVKLKKRFRCDSKHQSKFQTATIHNVRTDLYAGVNISKMNSIYCKSSSACVEFVGILKVSIHCCLFVALRITLKARDSSK